MWRKASPAFYCVLTQWARGGGDEAAGCPGLTLPSCKQVVPGSCHSGLVRQLVRWLAGRSRQQCRAVSSSCVCAKEAFAERLPEEVCSSSEFFFCLVRRESRVLVSWALAVWCIQPLNVSSLSILMFISMVITSSSEDVA